jgi:hypothetical protein
VTHSWWWFVADALAVARLSRLVTTDTITAHVRLGIAKRAHRVALWLSCDWCVSVPIAAAVVVLTVYTPGIWQYAAFGLALSAVAGHLSERD